MFPDIVSICWVIVSIFIGWIFCVWKGGLLDRQYCQYLESASSYRYWATITKVTPPLKIIELIFNENWRKKFTREFPTTFISILQFKCLKWESLDLKDNEHWLFRLLQDKFQGRTEWICTNIQPFTDPFNFFFLSMLPTLEITYHLYSSVRPGGAWRVLAGTRERLLFSIATSNNFSIATLDYGL